MRIISGKFGGRRFNPPKGLSARPTTDRAKEGLFNWLQHRIEFSGLSFLDLYAGTGNISFELVSRGARGVAVERDRKATAFIQKTLTDLGTKDLKIITSEVERYLNGPVEPFDLVFADPPYAMEAQLQLVQTVTENGWLRPGGLMVLEHYDRLVTDHPLLLERRSYGQSVFSIFQTKLPG